MYEAGDMAVDAFDDMVPDYRISWLAAQLHSIPRIDMRLRRVDATFRLDSQQYKEVRPVGYQLYSSVRSQLQLIN